MNNDLVSIVIPVKNCEQHIGEAIESCLSQTYKSVEIIVVDNGSTDMSVDIAHRYDKRGVRVLACHRGGASAARNVGLAAATGSHIQFLDSDDIIAANKIEVQMRRLAEYGNSASAICKWATFSSNIADSRPVNEEIFSDRDSVDFLVQLWTTQTMMAAFSWLVPRTIIENAGAWSEDLSWDDDGEFFTRVALSSEKVIYCEGTCGYYRQTASPSLSKLRSDEAMMSAYRACERSTNALLAKQNSPKTRLAAAEKFQYFVHLAYPSVRNLVRDGERQIILLGAKPRELQLGGKAAYLARLFGWKFARRLQELYRRAHLRKVSRLP